MKKAILLVISLLLAVSVLGGCGNDYNGLTVSHEAITIMQGRTFRLTADAEDVAWSIDGGAATIDAAGLVTGTSVGTATVTAAAGRQSATVAVTVIAPIVADGLLTREQILTAMTLTDNQYLARTGAYLPDSPEVASRYLVPLWESQIIHNETVLVVANRNGTISPISLSYPIAQVLDIRPMNRLNNDDVFREGVDFAVNNQGQLTFPLGAGSNLPIMPFDRYFMSVSASPEQWVYRHPDGGADTGVVGPPQRQLIREHHISVTYIRTTAFSGDAPVSRLDELTPGLEARMDSGTLNVVFMGDSITAGAGPVGIPPYVELVAQGLGHLSGRNINRIANAGTPIVSGSINYVNAGVGGIDTLQYLSMLNNDVDNMPYAGDVLIGNARPATVALHRLLPQADIVFMAFGVNDGGGWQGGGSGRSPAEFRTRMNNLINATRQINPDVNIVLVSSMMPCPRVFTSPSPQANPLMGSNMYYYEGELRVLAEAGQNITVAPVWSVKQALMSNGKPVSNFLAYGRNHPNDFMTRVYAQTILATVLPDGALPVSLII